jgi:hypothetical protein
MNIQTLDVPAPRTVRRHPRNRTLLLISAFMAAFGALTAAANAHAELLPLAPHTAWPTRPVPERAPAEVTLPLQQIWRLECGDNTEPLIGDIVSVAAGPDGRVLLVDGQLCHVMVVSADGKVERTVGRCGNGPGELTGAFRAVTLPDGRMGIADGCDAPGIQFGTRGNIVILDRDDLPVGELMAGGDPGGVPVCVPRDVRSAAGRILAVTYRAQVQPPKMTSVLELSLLDAASGEREIAARQLHTTDMTEPAINERDAYEPFASGRCDLSATGRLAMAPERDRWLVAVREGDGTGFVLERPWRSVGRSAAAREEARRQLGSDTSRIFETEPAIGLVRWRPDGHLWVEPLGAELPPGVVACFDEFTPNGALVRRVYLAVPGAAADARLLVLEDGRLALLEGFGREPSEDAGDLAPAVTLLVAGAAVSR